jgi:hypothetical protein
MSDWVITDKAIDEARSLGIAGDLKARLTRMLRRSVPIPGRKTARRFMGYELILNQNTLMGVAYSDLVD